MRDQQPAAMTRSLPLPSLSSISRHVILPSSLQHSYSTMRLTVRCSRGSHVRYVFGLAATSHHYLLNLSFLSLEMTLHFQPQTLRQNQAPCEKDTLCWLGRQHKSLLLTSTLLQTEGACTLHAFSMQQSPTGSLQRQLFISTTQTSQFGTCGQKRIGHPCHTNKPSEAACFCSVATKRLE